MSRRASADKVHVHLVCLPDKIKSVPDNRYRADEVVDSDVKGHSQQSDLWHAVANAGDQDIERRKRRERIADTRDEADHRVKAKPPTHAGNAKEVVEVKCQLIKAFFDLDLLML